MRIQPTATVGTFNPLFPKSFPLMTFFKSIKNYLPDSVKADSFNMRVILCAEKF